MSGQSDCDLDMSDIDSGWGFGDEFEMTRTPEPSSKGEAVEKASAPLPLALSPKGRTLEVRSLLADAGPIANAQPRAGLGRSRTSRVTRPAPVPSPLTEAEQAEFARAEFALGTEVGRPVSEEVWFQELQCLVPRSPARASSAPVGRGLRQASLRPQAPLPALTPPKAELPLLPELELGSDEPARPEKKRRGLWTRLRNSLR